MEKDSLVGGSKVTLLLYSCLVILTHWILKIVDV